MRFPWTLVWEEKLGDPPLTSDLRGFFQIPQANFASTFRLLVTAYTFGTISVVLSFGFTQTDALLVVVGNRIVFPTIGGVSANNASALRTPRFDRLAGPGGGFGSFPGICLPTVAVIITTTGGALSVDLTYGLYVAGLGG